MRLLLLVAVILASCHLTTASDVATLWQKVTDWFGLGAAPTLQTSAANHSMHRKAKSDQVREMLQYTSLMSVRFSSSSSRVNTATVDVMCLISREVKRKSVHL